MEIDITGQEPDHAITIDGVEAPDAKVEVVTNPNRGVKILVDGIAVVPGTRLYRDGALVAVEPEPVSFTERAAEKMGIPMSDFQKRFLNEYMKDGDHPHFGIQFDMDGLTDLPAKSTKPITSQLGPRPSMVIYDEWGNDVNASPSGRNAPPNPNRESIVPNPYADDPLDREALKRLLGKIEPAGGEMRRTQARHMLEGSRECPVTGCSYTSDTYGSEVGHLMRDHWCAECGGVIGRTPMIFTPTGEGRPVVALCSQICVSEYRRLGPVTEEDMDYVRKSLGIDRHCEEGE